MALLSGFIGVDRHSDSQIRDLTGARRDAIALWALFSDAIPDLNARLLTDDEATLSNVRQLFDETLGAAQADDVVLLSFSGHGTPDHRLVVANSAYENLIDTTIDMAELAARFRETRARAVVCLLDCCFSGGAPARVLDNVPIPRSATIAIAEVGGIGRVLIAASNVDEPALEDPTTRHGLFTKAILDCLFASEAPVSVLALFDDVVRNVRACAARFGHIQTPVMFGQVEGGFTLPAGRRGERFATAFPDQPAVQVTNSFSDLAAYGIDNSVIEAWTARYPAGLNSLQISAINDHGVLNDASLFVVAPTSAGKTFIGEIAGLKAIAQGQKVVFLLPYKALVNEKYEEFSEFYGVRLGLRVVRCSGDWQDQVGEFLRGKYDIAFLTYEKFLSLSLGVPYILNQIGLVVVDEAQFITESGRGMVVELLLTNIVSARERGVSPQVIALSAVIGHTNSFERWLGAGLLVATQRPVPLVEGVLDRSGTWRRAENGQIENIELLPRHTIQIRRTKPSSQDVIVPLVRRLVENGEKVIVFRNTRGASSGCAEYLAAELGLPPAQAVLDVLPERDLSSTSQRLRRSLAGGVAFHSSDLTREERAAVETGFRRADNQVRVLVATSTVAAGVNTPASTVIIVETGFYTADGEQPYTVAQYKNMAGRAGRLGYEREGKAIIIAETPMERDRFFRLYVQGNPEQITSSFDPRTPGTWVIRLLAQVGRVTRDQAMQLVANTYGGFLAAMADPSWRQRISPQIYGLLDRMLADGLLEQQEEYLSLTMLGRACGESALSFESAMQLVEILRRVGAEGATPTALMALIQALPEQDADYTPMARGSAETVRPAAVAGRFGHAISSGLRWRAPSDTIYYARCKRAIILADWIDGVPLEEIEGRYSPNAFVRVGHGDIRGFADATRFFLEPAMRIAAIVLEREELPEDATQEILKRLELGLPADILALTNIVRTLTRGDYLTLANAGLRTYEAVAAMSDEALLTLVGRQTSEIIKRRIAELAPIGVS